MQTDEMALKGIVLRKTKHRQILSIDLPTLTSYLRDLPTDSKGRVIFEVTENPNTHQHESISHYLTPLSPGANRLTKVDGPTNFKS